MLRKFFPGYLFNIDLDGVWTLNGAVELCKGKKVPLNIKNYYYK